MEQTIDDARKNGRNITVKTGLFLLFFGTPQNLLLYATIFDAFVFLTSTEHVFR